MVMARRLVVQAEILGIGTELLMGELNDTNAGWIAGRLPALGVTLRWVTLAGDDLGQLTEALRLGLGRSDVVFTTGGLGPTQDDLTREAVAAVLGESPAVDAGQLGELRGYFRARGQDMPGRNVKQAWLIPSAEFIPNRNGTAPGWWAEREGKVVVCLPGPPVEMQAMFGDFVAPRLRGMAAGEVTVTRNIKTMGLGEAAVDEVMSEYFGLGNPYLGIYSKADGIHLRVIARAVDEASARGLIAPVEGAVRERLGGYIWGYDDETPAGAAGAALLARRRTLAVMEGCTGGFLASAVTEVDGAGRFFRGGMVVLGVESLAAAGVSRAVLERYGAVSQAAANAMAGAVLVRLGADYGIGVAGADGAEGLGGRPLGLAYVGVAGAGAGGPEVLREAEVRVAPRRVTVRRRVSNLALVELRRGVDAGG